MSHTTHTRERAKSHSLTNALNVPISAIALPRATPHSLRPKSLGLFWKTPYFEVGYFCKRYQEIQGTDEKPNDAPAMLRSFREQESSLYLARGWTYVWKYV